MSKQGAEQKEGMPEYGASLVLGKDLARWVVYDSRGERPVVLSEEEWHWSQETDTAQALMFWLKERCKRDRLRPDQVRVLLANGSIRFQGILHKGNLKNQQEQDPSFIPVIKEPDRLRTIMRMLQSAGIGPEQISLKENALYETYSRTYPDALKDKTIALFSLEPSVMTVTLVSKNKILSAHQVSVDTGDCDLMSAQTRKLVFEEFRAILSYERELFKRPIDMIQFATDEPASDAFCKYLSNRIGLPVQLWNVRDLEFLVARARPNNPTITKIQKDLVELLGPETGRQSLMSTFRQGYRLLILGASILALYLGVMIWPLLQV